MKKQNISIAIVQNEQQQLLISRRQKGQHLAGKWEFPGGKVAEGEAYELAMLRELKEEVGLTATKYKLFDSLQFDYDQLKLNLHFYLVSEYSGEAKSLEGQEVKWISPKQLKDYDFPEANVGVINKLL